MGTSGTRRPRLTDRPYRKLTPDEVYQVEEWHRAHLALGNQKVFAARTGIPVARVAVIVAQMRRKGQG
jgi:hypothetical protein